MTPEQWRAQIEAWANHGIRTVRLRVDLYCDLYSAVIYPREPLQFDKTIMYRGDRMMISARES